MYNLSLTSALFSALAILVAVSYTSRRTNGQQIRSLNRAPAVLYILPFGLDLAWRLIKRLHKHEFLEFGREILDVPGHTVELHMLGVQLLVTDNHTNIKAILHTQFSDFGKGEIVHRQLDIVTHIFLGESTDSLDSERHAFREAMDAVLRADSGRISLGQLGCLIPDCFLISKPLNQIHGDMDRLISRTLAIPRAELEDKSERGILTLLESLCLDTPDHKYIKDQLFAVVLVAAKDPVALLSTWIIHELCQRPELVNKLGNEISERIGLDTVPTAEQVLGLPLLRNVVKETMRMYHPVGFNIRQATKDTFLPKGGGTDGAEPVHLHKGEQVAISAIHAQRRLEGCEDADVWNPSRWDSWVPKSAEFIPFNMGPRICLGRNFGRLQIHYLMVRLLQEHETIVRCGYGNGWDDTEPMKVKLEMNVKSDKPVRCKFVPRSLLTPLNGHVE